MFEFVIADLDFIEVRQEFSFEPGSMVNTIACVSVTLLDDLVIEMDEQLMLELEESEMVTVDKGRERASVLIIDNDGMPINNVNISFEHDLKCIRIRCSFE